MTTPAQPAPGSAPSRRDFMKATGLAAAHAAEPKDERVLGGLATARNLLAQLALAHGDATTARTSLAQAHAVLDPAWRAQENEGLRLVLANTLVKMGIVWWMGGAGLPRHVLPAGAVIVVGTAAYVALVAY